jgi:uncharacterized protein (DUF697 family)
MKKGLFPQLREAISNLNPSEVREAATRSLSVRLVSQTPYGYKEMADFLIPEDLPAARRAASSRVLHLAGEASAPTRFDIEIWDESQPAPAHAFVFSPRDPHRIIREILDRHEDLALPLSRAFAPFRPEVTKRLIHKVSFENAAFSLATALPNIAPFLGFAWAAGELVSDSVFLTVNQVRLVFLIGAASDRPIGYSEQKAEIGSIVAGAFGWRAIARELISKIPLGGGLIPKAAIAYAGTWVVGQSFERFYRTGHMFNKLEREKSYHGALARGREAAKAILVRVKEMRKGA